MAKGRSAGQRSVSGEELRAKFPQPAVSLPSPPDFSPTADISVSQLRHDVERAARSADSLVRRDWGYWVRAAILRPRHSCAPGPDGLRYSHLRQLLVLPDVGPRLQALAAELVDLVASGRFSPSLLDLSATAVPKDGGGVRPIGVASVWRRIPSFIAASHLAYLTPAITGLGQLATAPAGPQLIARRAQRCVTKGLLLARMDVTNAYCSLDRRRLLQVIDELIDQSRATHRDTGALRAMRTMYASSEEIFYASRHRAPFVFTNESGVTQGCPAGAFLFGAVMADVLTRTRHVLGTVGLVAEPIPAHDQPLPSAAAVGYLALHDDVVFASEDQDSLEAAIAAFKDQLAAAGMRLGLGDGKSMLVVEDQAAVQPSLLAALGDRRSPVVKCAGVPVHVPSPDAEREADRLLQVTARACLHPLRALDVAHPQDIVKVLAVAGSRSRLQYHASCTAAFPSWPELASEGDALTRELLTAALGGHAGSTTEGQYLMAILQASEGGLGVRSCILEREADRRAAKVIHARDSDSPDDLEAAITAHSKELATLHRRIASLAAAAAKHSDLDLVQLSHQKRPEVAGLWTANVSAAGRTRRMNFAT